MALFDFFTNLFNKEQYFYSYKSKYHCDSNVLVYNPLEWYQKNPVVNYAINERAKAVAQFKFYTLNQDGTRNYNDPIVQKLNKPNDYQTGNEFLRQSVINMSIYGVTYPYINRKVTLSSIKNSEIILIDNFNLEYKIKGNYFFNKLNFTDNEVKVWYKISDNVKELYYDSLLPIYDTPPINNPFDVHSRLKPLQYIVSNIQTLLESKNTILSNPGGIGVFTSMAKDANGTITLTPKEREQAEKELSKRYGTRGGQSANQLLSTPTNFLRTSPKIDEFKFNENFTNDSLVIFGAFGLPKELFTALQEGSTFENQSQAYKRFLESEGQSIADQHAQTFGTYYGKEIFASCDHLPIFQENEKERADIKKIEIETLNSVLANNGIDEKKYQDLVKNILKL